MDLIVSLFVQHGLLAVFLGVLVEQMGAPFPSLPFLLLAGVASAGDSSMAFMALAAATLATMLANSLWFVVGRRFGRRVLALLCRISISADSCVRQSELNFARFGAGSLIMVKFVPGLSILAPPLAGALGMKVRRFTAYSLAGATLWAGSGIVAGMVFRDQILLLLTALRDLGNAALLLLGTLLAAYLAARVWHRRRVTREMACVPRIQPAELAELMLHDDQLVLVDVQPVLPGLAPARRIPGARHVELSQIGLVAMQGWPAQAEVVTYCACANDVAAVRAAQLLAQRGIHARVLKGGVDGWVSAGKGSDTWDWWHLPEAQAPTAALDNPAPCPTRPPSVDL